MAGKKRDLIGCQFGRLTVIGAAESRHTSCGAEAMWLCRCTCGAEVIKRSRMLLRGRLLSCGCLKTPHGHNRRGKRTRTYRSWVEMISRCERPSVRSYKDYGARGITVCERWHKFESFLADMGERPPGLTLERKDVNGNYERSNCYWATVIVQANNKRRTAYVDHRGERLPVHQLAARVGLPGNIVYARVFRYGWSVTEAVSTPVLPRGNHMGRRG